MADPEVLTDEEVAATVKKGDAEAFGELMRRYEDRLKRYGRRFVGNSDAIDDAVQETFIRTYQNIQSFDTTQRFSPWIYRIAHNVYANVLRSKSRNRVIAVDLDTFVPHATYDDPALREREQGEMRAAIEAGMENLAPHYREVLVLYYLEELSYQEIADVIQVPVGTVGIRLSRAKKELKKHLDPSILS